MTETAKTGFVPPPPENIRERFTISTERISNGPGVGPSTKITVLDNGEPVHEFLRNLYAAPFEPFRQFRDGAWFNYALISPEYTKFAVLDLQTYEVIEQSPGEFDVQNFEKFVQRRAERGDKATDWEHQIETPADFLSAFGFCPIDFYVPDWWELRDHDFNDIIEPGDDLWDEEDERPDGSFGFLSGCHWGDDSSWKIRSIDLSRLHEGIVTSDDRFGYIEQGGKTLADSISYSHYTDRVDISTSIWFNRHTGVAEPWSIEGINSPLVKPEG